MGSVQRMVYREFEPGKVLRAYVVAYWSFRLAPTAGEILHSIPLTGAAMLSASMSAGRMILLGPRTARDFRHDPEAREGGHSPLPVICCVASTY